MAEASTIGANFSQYTGDPNLGGGTLGFFKLDTRPLEDFARYTMLYNREEQARKQKEAEKAAEELGKIADYDLTTSIPKDAKVLQEKYDKLITYVKQNPGALQFKNRDQWIEYQKRKNELANDIRGAKVRNVMNMAREKQIADEKDENVKNFMRSQLTKEIDEKDIRTPIFYTQEYDMTIPDFGLNKGQSLLVNRFLANQIIQDGYEIFDASEARRKGTAFALGVDFDESTITGQLKQKKLESNFYVKGAELLNQAIANAMVGIDPSLDDKAKDEIIKSKLSGIGIVKNIDALNKYLEDTQRRIKAGEYRGNNLNVDDFTPINWKDGLSPEELAVVAQFSAWEGDTRNSKILQTNDAIERARIGLGYANLDLERQKQLSSQTEDWISADAVVRTVQDIIKNATPIELVERGNNTGDVKGVTKLKEIAEPALMKEFGNIDKDGNITNVPDKVLYDEKTNQLSLLYYQKEDGEIKINEKTNNPFVERRIGLDANEWMSNIVRRRNPNKDIGGVNAIVQQIYTKNGRNLVELANNYGGQGAVGTTKTTSTQSSSSTELSENPADWKKEGNNWRYKDGRVFDSKGNLIKQ